MFYPTVDEFKDIVVREPLDVVVHSHILGGTPYVFRLQPELLTVLRDHICDELGVAGENVIVVGSAKVGFSLNPDSFPRLFSDESDIDVVVIDTALFEKMWSIILRWHYQRRYVGLQGTDRDWAGLRKKEVYWGWFEPAEVRVDRLSLAEELKPLVQLRTSWFNAFRSLSRYPEFATRDINGRLYRSWEHAVLYHIEGLRRIREIVKTINRGALK